MSRRRASLLTLAFALAWPWAASADLRSLVAPGKLARAHADLENRCDACHVPFKGIPDSACLGCHDRTAARIQEGRGPHAVWTRPGPQQKKCVACHGDHKGADFRITPSVEPTFDHHVTGFDLAGAHKRAACAACHPQRGATTKWADLPRDCAGCHRKDDTHRGALGDRCQACHGDESWKSVRHGRGEHKVPLDGAHAGLDCARCHGGGSHLAATPSCGDCHKQPHGGTKAPCASCHVPESWKKSTFTHDFCTCFLPGKHQTAPCLGCHPAFRFNPTPMDCAGCHQKDLKHEPLGACARCHSALSFSAKVFDHNKPAVRFPLKDRHFEVGCENCHTKKGVFRGAPKSCEGCHKQPAHGDFGPCGRCHTEKGFLESTFSHQSTRFPLDGVHAEVGCRECHDKLEKSPFQPGPNACVGCHQSPHREQFGLRGLPGLRDSGPLGGGRAIRLADAGKGLHVVSPRRGCLDCHSFRAWKPSTVDVARHGELGFELRGAHAKVACGRCHEAGQYAGTPKDCASCHLDRHGGRFGADCTRCHNESGWRDHPPLDHAAETGFALAGAHARATCAGCHGPSGADLRGRSPVGCATCHSTGGPRGHGDQFGADCSRCHQPTRFSEVPPFDHRTTRFPLERRHAVTACTACHSAARGRPAMPACLSCHGDPHRGRATLDCTDCHRADDWKVIRFDHDRSTFRLNGRHFGTPCRDCHVGNVFSGVRRECIYCHRGERMRIDSNNPGHRRFAYSCNDCHAAFSWRPLSM